jgi:hypothetical protein
MMRTYPLTRAQLSVAKVLDMATGKSYFAAIDDQGQPADLQAVALAEEDVRRRQYGKLDPRLYQQLARMPANRATPVSIWLKDSSSGPARKYGTTAGQGPASRRAAEHNRLADQEQSVAPTRRNVLGVLARMKAKVDVPSYSPVVFASLTPGQIRLLAQEPDVSAVYGAGNYGKLDASGGTTHRAFIPWMRGNRGAGVGGVPGAARPAVLDPQGIANTNPFLKTSARPVLYWCSTVSAACPSGMNKGDHASAVAGVVASTHPLERGIANGSPIILSANSQTFDDAKLVEAFEWAVANGGNPIVVSWGTDCGGSQTFMSRYLDWAVRHLGATIVVAAGNHPTACPSAEDDEKVAAPGVAWNVITVGSHSDANTGFWSRDSMSVFSDWRNPDFAPGMEKPEVVAVGQDIRTTDAQGGDHLTAVGVDGTSYAAAQVGGQVALMLSRRPDQAIWPETNKAAVLASARHDIEPGTDRDGVGSVDMATSDNTYFLGRFANDCNASCAPLEAADFPRTYPLTLKKGQAARVAIAWDSNSDGVSSDVLGADIDLCIRHPNGEVIIACSVSAENAWELVDFTAPVTGEYEIVAELASEPDQGWPGTFLGMAWSLREQFNVCSYSISVPNTGGTYTLPTKDGSAFFNTYAGWSRSQTGRERLFRIILDSTRDLTVTDANPNLDLHVLRIANCNADPLVPTVLGNGQDSVFVDNLVPGTYYIAVDGANGAVGSTKVTINVSGP